MVLPIAVRRSRSLKPLTTSKVRCSMKRIKGLSRSIIGWPLAATVVAAPVGVCICEGENCASALD